MNSLVRFYIKSKKSDISFFIIIIKHIYYRILGKNIFASNSTKIRGVKNITTISKLQIGIEEVAFMLSSDKTFLNIEGELVVQGNAYIGKGCRMTIGGSTKLVLNRVFINANCLFVISNGLEIGDNTVISWNCQFIDDDFHKINYKGKVESSKKINIGNHVWIGANSVILKGVYIADGCVIAANSIVTKSVTEQNVLIAGNPAKIIKREIQWEI
jgi:acetyltransferase-like isoleucine patch superfamily enzyme